VGAGLGGIKDGKSSQVKTLNRRHLEFTVKASKPLNLLNAFLVFLALLAPILLYLGEQTTTSF